MMLVVHGLPLPSIHVCVHDARGTLFATVFYSRVHDARGTLFATAF